MPSKSHAVHGWPHSTAQSIGSADALVDPLMGRPPDAISSPRESTPKSTFRPIRPPVSGRRVQPDAYGHSPATTEVRVARLSASLEWSASRLSHQLSRMERRRQITRDTEGPGHVVEIALIPRGQELVLSALHVHARAVGRSFLTALAAGSEKLFLSW